MTVKVRFAPSPTGIPHVGNIRTSLFNYFFAKSSGGEFILRIEDTDQARRVEGAVGAIEKSLAWLGVKWDERFVQSENLETYKSKAWELVSLGRAREEEGAIRFVVPEDGSTSWIDGVGNKKVEFKNSEVEDFIILKSDGYPTYHLANVVDDHDERITHVIRGEDWIPSTPKHIMLYQALGWSDQIPVFVHVSNILGTDGKKLSKRRGAKSVLDYKKEGILSDALLNYLMLLGWSPKDDRELLSKEEIEKEFRLENINSSPAIFDEKKLLWMNGEYLRRLKTDDLRFKILEYDSSVEKIENFEKYIPLAQTRMKTLADFRGLVENNLHVELNEHQRKFGEILIEKYKDLDPWNASEISSVTLSLRDELECSTKDIFMCLTGKPQGLPFEQKLVIDGKEKTISWLEHIIN